LGNAVRHAEQSPDGTRVAFGSRVSGHHDIWTQNVDGSEPRQLTADASVDTWPTWSPDGRWIAFNTTRDGANETWRVSASGGTPEKLDDGIFRGDWIRQPDGQGTWLVSSKGGGRIRLLDVERRRVVWEQPVGAGAFPQFSPDGELVSTIASEGPGRSVVWLLDARTGQPRRMAVRFPGFFTAEFRVNWIDNGRALLVTRGENVSHVVMFDKFWSPEARGDR
jgi:TolB protein